MTRGKHLGAVDRAWVGLTMVHHPSCLLIFPLRTANTEKLAQVRGRGPSQESWSNRWFDFPCLRELSNSSIWSGRTFLSLPNHKSTRVSSIRSQCYCSVLPGIVPAHDSSRIRVVCHVLDQCRDRAGEDHLQRRVYKRSRHPATDIRVNEIVQFGTQSIRSWDTFNTARKINPTNQIPGLCKGIGVKFPCELTQGRVRINPMRKGQGHSITSG
jgi:hypothetical protein